MNTINLIPLCKEALRTRSTAKTMYIDSFKIIDIGFNSGGDVMVETELTVGGPTISGNILTDITVAVSNVAREHFDLSTSPFLSSMHLTNMNSMRINFIFTFYKPTPAFEIDGSEPSKFSGFEMKPSI